MGVAPEFAATKGQGEKKRAPRCLVVTMGRGRRQVSSAGLGEKRRSVSRAMRLAPVMCGWEVRAEGENEIELGLKNWVVNIYISRFQLGLGQIFGLHGPN